MNQLEINHSYTFTQSDTIELPKGYSADDIQDYYIKWGTIYITFKDGVKLEIESDPDMSGECVDWKRPSCVAIHKTNSDGEVDYDTDYGDSNV